MVETATFSIFHRAPPVPEPAAAGRCPEPGIGLPANPASPPIAGGAAPPPHATDARARRRVARRLFHKAEVQPPAPAWDAATPEPAASPQAVREPAEATPSASAPAPPPVHSVSLALDYQLLGLASPAAFIGTVGASAPIRLSIGHTGLYGPDERPALRDGFADQTSPDRWTGLAAGTRILTARGEIPVEQLVLGDAALTLRGPALLPILWIGRSVSAGPPVKIDAGAFGPDRPRRDLYVAAEHALFLETTPVTARELVNGHTIRALSHGSADLFHIDVGAAEVLLAEGVPLASGRR